MHTNFEFLHELYPELEGFGTLAETYLYSDPNNCMIKAGLLCEKMTVRIFQYEKLYLNPRDSQADRITKLGIKDIITQEIEKYLTVVRKNRNDAAHDGFNSLKHARISLRYTYECCVWFMEVYGDYDFEAAPYAEPENISQDKNYQELIEEHERKLAELEQQLKQIQEANKQRNLQTIGLAQITEDEYKELETATRFFNVRNTDPISVLELSVRCSNALKRAKIFLVEQLMALSEAELIEIRNLGKKSVEEILSVQKRVRIVETTDDDQQPAVIVPGEMLSANEGKILQKYFAKRDMPIMDMGMELSIKKNLLRFGYEKLTDILTITAETLKQKKGLGSKKIEKILEERDKLVNPICQKIRQGVITLENADQPDDTDLDEMIFNLFLQSSQNVLSLVDLVSMITGTMDLGQLSASIGRLVVSEKIVLNDNGTYELKLPSIMEIAQKIENEKRKKVLLVRLSGKTLDEVGKEVGVSRERIRQLEEKSLDAAYQILYKEYGLTKFAEDRYAEIASVYSIDQDAWVNYVGISKETYHYFELKKYKGKQNAEQALSDEQVNLSVREKLQNYFDRDCVYIEGTRVVKTKAGLENYLIIKKCHNDTTIKEFFDMYRALVEELGIKEDDKCYLKDSEEQSRENRITSLDLVLWKYGKRFRFYDTRNAEDFRELYDTLSLDAYHNTEFSAKKLFILHPEVMRAYDIRDEYELHNLLRKTINKEKYPNIDLSRTPTLGFGSYNREEALYDLLCELSPISKEDLVDAIVDEFGAKKSTIKGSWLKCLNLYYHQGQYRVDYEPIPAEQVEPLLALLNEDFYFTSEIRELYMKNISGAEEKYISPYNLKNMGFSVYSKYVIRNTYKNASEYFTAMLTANDSFNISSLNRKYTGILEYSITLTNLRRNYSIIEVEPLEYVTMAVLEKQGITKETLKEYCDQVADFVSDDYFTIYSLRNNGFEYQIDGHSYSDWFYGAVVREDERFSFQRTMPQQLLRKTSEPVTRKGMISEIIDSEKEISLNALLSILRKDYGLDVCKSDIELAISDSEVYYDPLKDKYYATYGIYKKLK